MVRLIGCLLVVFDTTYVCACLGCWFDLDLFVLLWICFERCVASYIDLCLVVL